NRTTQHAHYSYRHFPKHMYYASTQTKLEKPPPGCNVAFREPIADPTHLYTPLATDSQSGTPIGSPAKTPFTPAIGGMLPLPVVTPMAEYAAHLPPPTPYPLTTPLSADVAAPATWNVAPAPAQDNSAPPLPPRAPSPQPVAPPAPPTNASKAAPGGKPPVADAKGQSKSVFNIYTRDMLPSLPARGIARDPKWKGASAEKINVLMPVDLLSCWLILYNAQRLKEVHFWHVRGNDSGRKFPTLSVRSLESFYVHNNEAWLTNLLDSLRTEHLKHLEVYYAPLCASRFMHDLEAYIFLFDNALHIQRKGIVCISPNHPIYGSRSSRLEGALCEYVRNNVLNASWTISVRDIRSQSLKVLS
ncbi:hypothetical protein EV714DRAFT_214864, partial [Schizophyllum commune]